MRRIQKILWPTDLSGVCDMVLPHIKDLAETHQAEIEVLYVTPDLGDVGDWYGETTPEHVREFNRWEQDRAQKRLDEMCEADLGPGFTVTRKAVVGDPYSEIMKAAAEDDIDLIVISSRGRGSEKRGGVDFGSVADKVVKNSAVPVFVVNPA